ncbi:hypothetical protein ACQUFY_12790 [Robbsia andropogonis]|uniref:hypothetical protein n=1 Tax=Robbsia andropogonis TaxID=28092 RepID=UPI003D1F4C25
MYFDDEIEPLWYLHDHLSVMEAAALIADYDPGRVQRCQNDTNFERNFSRLYPAQSALINAITNHKLAATLRYDAEPRYLAGLDNLEERGRWNGEEVREIKSNDDESFVIGPVPNWHRSTVAVENVRSWLSSRGYRAGFFFPEAVDAPDYLDSSTPRYAPKLAAAVSAWQSVTNPDGKHPKQALMKWLREHAAKFGLTDDEGKPNETGIEEVAKVANWQSTGGAPKTPGS